MKRHSAQRRRTAGRLTRFTIAAAPLVMMAAAQSAIAQVPSIRADGNFQNFPSKATPREGAPNIIVIMTDDVGFGAPSTFGGPVPTPALDALAANGLRYNNFHTTAMCSPTRAALLTGRNHHRVGFGLLSDVAIDEPGYNGILPDSAATFGRVMRDAGYDTAWLGKNHNTPPWEAGPTGPFDRWPNGLGFDYFYGFNAAMTDQFKPTLNENRNPVSPPAQDESYILDRDLTDHGIDWLRRQQSVDPDRPFLLYYAPGTAHSPQQAPADWIARFHGKFDQGWDVERQRTFERQRASGVIPADARLAPRPDAIPAWDTLTPEEQQIAARGMEVHAAQLAFFDHQIGRLVDELKRLDQYEDTMIIFIQGDNGASVEGGLMGTNNDLAALFNNEVPLDFFVEQGNSIGSAESYPNYTAGWGFAMNTPFPWAKQVASHLGGLRDGMVISWPAGISARGEVREQFGHVNDIAPTLYEVAGISPPTQVDGEEQMSFDGCSLAYSFALAEAPACHREQYFELLGNRSFYRDGWLASTVPENVPWNHKVFTGDPNKYDWQLFDLKHDFSQTINVAAEYPERLAELQQGFDAAARENNIYPLDADIFSRLNDNLRPSAIGHRDAYVLQRSEQRYAGHSFPVLGARPWNISAKIAVPEGGSDGTLIGQGGWAMSWGLFVENGRPTYVLRPSDHDPEVRLQAPESLSEGAHDIGVSFTPQAGTRGGTVSLLVNGNEVDRANTRIITGFGSQAVGIGRLFSESAYGHLPPFRYEGTIDSVTVTFPAP